MRRACHTVVWFKVLEPFFYSRPEIAEAPFEIMAEVNVVALFPWHRPGTAHNLAEIFDWIRIKLSISVWTVGSVLPSRIDRLLSNERIKR
jgi:hypothetical protein